MQFSSYDQSFFLLELLLNLESILDGQEENPVLMFVCSCLIICAVFVRKRGRERRGGCGGGGVG